MHTIKVDTASKKYDIIIDQSFEQLAAAIKSTNATYSQIFIISDDQVAGIYGEQVQTCLKELTEKVHVCTFPHGESHKNYETINQFYAFLLAHQADRKALIVALGGGVTGDMAGFTAATFMRGIAFIQVPTSLLSQVDSSIGGKTGIDFDGYKNVVGAFYQPELVYINTATLQTLPTQEFNSGMGEVIKHGLIKDTDYFNWLIQEAPNIQALDHESLTHLIRVSCEIKAKVVSEDEKESGSRALLNFGHTAGHAVERLKDFKMLHGECVGVGMIVAAHISYQLGTFSLDELQYVLRIIEVYHLPTEVQGLDIDAVYLELFFDKKTSHSQLNFALLNGIGNSYLEKAKITEDIVKKALSQIL